MLFAVVSLCVSFATTTLSNDVSNTPRINDDELGFTDYYWREYSGDIPADALPGGIDKGGKRTYIGQMYHRVGLLPATIYPGSRSALASEGGSSFWSEDFIKILCSRNPSRYRWIATKNEEGHLLADCHLVIGGTESGFVLNIGRVKHETETIIGKIFAYHTPFRGLSIPNKGKEHVYHSYQILTYDCNLGCLYTLNATHADDSIY